MDAETRRVVDGFQKELARLNREVDTLRRGQRTPQLSHSSIESGSLDVVDPGTGETRARIGWLPDGTVGMVTEGGDPVSAPTAPAVTPSLGGLRITWDGTLANEVTAPADLDHMAVHVSTTSGFTPSAETYVGTIRRAGDGGMLPVVPLPYVPHYVLLVPVTTGGVQGTPSAEATATPLQTSGIDLEADSVEAVHIKAGAVEADKLQAVLALVTTVIAGIPGAARVELDQDGLRGYNNSNELVFVVDASGSAVFSGDVTGATISGGELTAQATDDAESRIELLAGAVDTAIHLWPSSHPTITWAPAQMQCIHYGGRGRFRVLSPYQDGESFAEIEMAGWTEDSPYTLIDHYADYTRFYADPGTIGPGVVSFDNSVSLQADFHAPKTQDMLTNPDFTTTGSFVDFAAADFPPISFETGESGRVDVTIAMSGRNHNTDGSSIALSFRLSGGSTVAPTLKRCVYSRSIGAGITYLVQSELTVPLQLAPNAQYTLTPAYRISSGSSSTATFDLALPNSITVRNTL